MEESVAQIAYDAHIGSQVKPEPIGDWFDAPSNSAAQLALAGAHRIGKETWLLSADIAADSPFSESMRAAAQRSLLSHATDGPLDSGEHRSIFQALRADSAGAPSNHREAASMGPPWPASELIELDNHRRNESWSEVTRAEIPHGRRIHKLVWVYKLKRDGTAKARLCIQGCTLDKGIDFDQTFSKTLRYSSARALFAFAARTGCKVRSVDWVAAYLQGKFMDGEVIYCHLPPGYEKSRDGQVLYARVQKPIYGAPQSGRRLQRQVFPWMTDVMKMRQLDESDGCVFVYDSPDGEIFACGIYVDNLQIVHSAELDDDGNAVDSNSFYAKFMEALRRDWEVVDEGRMVDLLGIECEYLEDGSIKLHQRKYIEKLTAKFFPNGLPKHVQKNSLPFTANIKKHVDDAQALLIDADGKKTVPIKYPELVTPFQERLGSVMYLCNSARPDVVYPTHLLCRCMHCPTPELMVEADHVLAYLARSRDVGITYSPGDHEPSGMSDASWEERHSTSGWVTWWQWAALTWGSRKQDSIALSSCEAEINALSEATKDMVYIRRLVSGLAPSAVSGASTLGTDNMGARDTAYNPVGHERMKHVARRHFFVRDMVESFEITVPFVPTKENAADFFTKALSPKEFYKFRAVIMNETHNYYVKSSMRRDAAALGRV